MKTCTRCLIKETVDSITFDDTGICSVCRQVEFKKEEIDWDERAHQLETIIGEHRNKGLYDCIVPYSGGKDSVFQLWYIVKKLKLKPLVVRYNHWGYRPLVDENNTKVFKQLGVDVIELTTNFHVVRELMLESLKRRGDFCWHCHTGIFSYPMRIACKFKIPLIIWGEPTGEYASFYSYDEKEEVNEERFNRFVNLGINAEDMRNILKEKDSKSSWDKRDFLPFTYPSRKELRELKCESVLLGHFIPWDVKKQVKIIKDELGWKGDEVEGIPEIYDYEKVECFMQGVRDYLKFLKRGIGRTNHLVGIDIRNNRMSRKEGIRLMKQYDGKRPHSLDLFLNFLDLDETEFMNIVKKHIVVPNVEENEELEKGKKTHDHDKWTLYKE